MLKRAIFFHIRTLQLGRPLDVQHINQAENPFPKWKGWFFFFFSCFLMTYISSLGTLRALAVIVLSWRRCWHINCTLMEFFWQRQGWEYRHSHLHYVPKHNIKEVDVEQRVFGTRTWTRRGVIWRKRSVFFFSLQCSSVITFNQILNKSQSGLLLYWQGTGEDTNMKYYGFIPSSNSIMHIWALFFRQHCKGNSNSFFVFIILFICVFIQIIQHWCNVLYMWWFLLVLLYWFYFIYKHFVYNGLFLFYCLHCMRS